MNAACGMRGGGWRWPRALALAALASGMCTGGMSAAQSGDGPQIPAQAARSSYEVLLSEARSALDGVDLAKAEKLAYALTVLDRTRWEGHTLLGAALAALGWPMEARAAFATALVLAPEDKRGSIDALMQRSLAAGGSAPNAGAAPSAGADGTRTRWDARELPVEGRRRWVMLQSILRDMNAAQGTRRRELGWEFLSRSGELLEAEPNFVPLWAAQATVSAELGASLHGWLAGKRLLELKADRFDRRDVAGALAALERLRWLRTQEPPPYALPDDIAAAIAQGDVYAQFFAGVRRLYDAAPGSSEESSARQQILAASGAGHPLAMMHVVEERLVPGGSQGSEGVAILRRAAALGIERARNLLMSAAERSSTARAALFELTRGDLRWRALTDAESIAFAQTVVDMPSPALSDIVAAHAAASAAAARADCDARLFPLLDKLCVDFRGQPAEGLRWLERGAQRGNPAAMLALARSYCSGDRGVRDPVQAEAWYRKAVALEPEQAVALRIELARALDGGCGGEPRPHEAARLWVEVAQRQPDDAEFRLRLERIVEPGVPLPADRAAARQMLFARAAAALLLDERGVAWAAARSLGALGIEAGSDDFERRALGEIKALGLDGEQPPPPRYTVVAKDPDPELVTDAVARARIRATGLPWKVRHERTGIELVLIPSGEFLMGSPKEEQGREPDESQHQRSIGTHFYLSQTEVTREQWDRVMPSLPRASGRGPQHPVNDITWLAATEFCARAGRGVRLPSEAEWEYACRGGTATPYWFGADGGQLAEFEWCTTNSGGSLQPVATLRPNRWGLFDMQGNVAEWCADSKFDYPTAGDATPASRAGPWRAMRGGTWTGNAGRSADRSSGQQDAASESSGFRVVMTP